MKKLFTIAAIFGASAFATVAKAQTFGVAYDTVSFLAPLVSTTEHDNISVTGMFGVNLKWTVMRGDFPTDWMYNTGGGSTAFCDNSGCYPISVDTSGTVQSATYTSSSSDFHMLISLVGATSTGTHYITVKFMSSNDTLYETYIVTYYPTYVPQVKQFSDIDLYPNPATSSVNVVFDESLDVKTVAVYNIIGKMMSMYRVNGNSANINLENVNSGIYFLRLMNAQGDVVSTRKFTKQ